MSRRQLAECKICYKPVLSSGPKAPYTCRCGNYIHHECFNIMNGCENCLPSCTVCSTKINFSEGIRCDCLQRMHIQCYYQHFCRLKSIKQK